MKRTQTSRLTSNGRRSSTNRRALAVLPSIGNPGVLQQVHEVVAIDLVTTGAGVVSLLQPIRPSSLISAARLAGYQAIADEVRIDQVKVLLTPIYGKSSSGRVSMYIERDPAASIVATTLLASDQRETSVGTLRDPLSITWRPQEPDDLQFNLLNPGTTQLGSIGIVGDALANGSGVAIPITTSIFTMRILVTFTIRGRP